MIVEVPVDDSPCLLLIASSRPESTPAFEYAVALAKACDAPLCIIAFDHMKVPGILGMSSAKMLSDHADIPPYPQHRWLESQVEHERHQGLDITVHRLWASDTFDDIHTYLSRFNPSLLIKDMHHEPSLKRFFSTPLDWQLLRRCRCPIQFVAGSSSPLPRKILAAVNLYRPSDLDLQLNDTLLISASRLALQCLASLHAVYVYDWSAIYAAGAAVFGTQPVEEGFQEALSEAHEEAFERLCTRHGIESGHRHFLTAPPRATLEAFARKNEFDLLVMGALPHDQERIMGDTAEALLFHAPCSVLVVKAGTLKNGSWFNGFSDQGRSH